jgi:hypothetical protein
MNISELKMALEKTNVDPYFASLDGEVKAESLVLERPESGGWCVYYSERGQRTGERWFITEEEACQYIFDSLSRDPLAKKRN